MPGVLWKGKIKRLFVIRLGSVKQVFLDLGRIWVVFPRHCEMKEPKEDTCLSDAIQLVNDIFWERGDLLNNPHPKQNYDFGVSWYETLYICKAAEVATSSCLTFGYWSKNTNKHTVADSSQFAFFCSGLLGITDRILEVVLALAELKLLLSKRPRSYDPMEWKKRKQVVGIGLMILFIFTSALTAYPRKLSL